VLFLTATPVQNKLEDLWHLLRLLSPEEFPVWPLFQKQVAANRLVLSAQHALTQNPPAVLKARSLLEDFAKTHGSTFLLSREFLSSILARLDGTNLERDDFIELHADIAQLSLLGHIISRTRKVEAMPDRAIRFAMWSGVTLTDAEREIYNRVEALCRMAWPGTDSWGFRMSLLMAYRATSSSIPAAVIFQRCVQSSQVPFNGFLSFHASAANIRAQRHCHCFAFRKRFVHAAAPVLVERGISVPKRPFGQRHGVRQGTRGRGVIYGSALWKCAT